MDRTMSALYLVARSNSSRLFYASFWSVIPMDQDFKKKNLNFSIETFYRNLEIRRFRVRILEGWREDF